jgi:2-polyprenyl-3-methyl-5-hydroxy-6-metoxy-1,4-benzoquinol methylase
MEGGLRLSCTHDKVGHITVRRVLEVGCGRGEFAERLAQAGLCPSSRVWWAPAGV